MELGRLRSFVAVADALNFRVAAERLHLSQPAVTRSIAALEKQLGVRLFRRDKTSVVLTAEGSDLLWRARQILAGVDEFTFAAHAMGVLSGQILHVGVFGNGLAELTDVVFRTFKQRCPGVNLEIHDAGFDRGIQPLLAGDFHVALVRIPVDIPVLRTAPVFREPTDILLSRAHRLAGAPSVDVSDLFDESWVTLPATAPGAWAAHWLAVPQRGESMPIVGKYACSEYEFHAAVAYEGHVGVAPRSSLRLRPHPGLRAVPARGVTPMVAAVVHLAVGYEPVAAVFAEIAAEVGRENLSLVQGATAP